MSKTTIVGCNFGALLERTIERVLDLALVVCMAHGVLGVTVNSDTVIDYLVPAGEHFIVVDGVASPTVVDLIDGGVMGKDVDVYQRSVFNHRGGTSHGQITAYDMATVNLYGGLISEGEQVVATSNGTVNVFGGTVLVGLEGFRNGTINIYGGDVPYVNLHGHSLARVFGTDLRYDEVTRRVSGRYLDGSAMHVEINLEDDTARFILVPEPCQSIYAIVGVSTLLSRWHRKKRQQRD